ncbi:MAG: dCTP deaminase [Deltaproteobacteria bacterium RBG_16_49_23]|nr:MAG: dCTP deaminase [Deltaproteobacteria bacterium RBG_16_49_23]
MGVLTREEILKEIRRGTIEIEPFIEDQIGPGSIDLHLGEEFRVFKKLRNALTVEDNISVEDLTERITTEDSFTLMPGETVLGITRERVKLPSNICGWLEGRSRFARMGLVIHMTAGFVQPGINNRQVLEIGNLAPFPLVLKPGVRICQLVLQRTEGEASYQGRFMNQNRL